MGTRMRIVVEAETEAEFREISEAILNEVERMDGMLSTWDSTSPMSRANQAPHHLTIPLPGELAEILSEALAWVPMTHDAFDPVVGALVDAWDLRGPGRLPDQGALSSARAVSGSHLFRLTGGPRPSLTRLSSGAWLDTGGFGKGAALRAAARRISGKGPPSSRMMPRSQNPRVLLDLGGQIWAQASPEDPWLVGVAHPLRRQETIMDLSIHDASVATSGTSERWIQVDGSRFGHILDPRTGLPSPAWGSVTVVSRDAMVADILSTALYVMGPEAGWAWVRQRPEVGAVFLEVCLEGLRATWNRAMEEWLTRLPPEGGDFVSQHQSCTKFNHYGGSDS